MKSVCIAYGLSCPRSTVDVVRLHTYVRANGWSLADRLEDADVVIVSGCGFDVDHESRSLSLLQAADRRRKPGSRLVVVGCLGGIVPDKLRATFDADLVPPVRNADLDEILGATVRWADIADPNELEPHVRRAARHFHPSDRHPADGSVKALVRWTMESALFEKALLGRGRLTDLLRKERFWDIRVAYGCLGECAYCAIKFATGPLVSKPLSTVLSEFEAGLERGHTQFRLLAGDLGCYGQDIGTNVAELLGQMMGRTDDFKLTLVDFDLKWFIAYEDALIDLIARRQTRIRSILAPMQSGSEQVLERMRRGHTARDAHRALVALRRACPQLTLNTHVLVGFPGETESDFEDTLDMLRAVRFDGVVFYEYGDRPGTEASAMPDKVPPEVIRARAVRARREFGGRWAALRFHAKSVGPPTTVMPSRQEG